MTDIHRIHTSSSAAVYENITERTQSEISEAFQRWQIAARAWSSAYRSLNNENNFVPYEKILHLRTLEEKLSELADIYKKALQEAN